MNVLDILEERGFIEQTTHDQELRDCLDQGNVTCYIGFDPTAAACTLAVWYRSCLWPTCNGWGTGRLP